MILFLILSIAALQPVAPSRTPAEWLAHAGALLEAGNAGEALTALRRGAEGGLPRAATTLLEIRALAALGRHDEAVAILAQIPAPSGGIVAALKSQKHLESFLERADVKKELVRLTPCSDRRHREFDFWIGEWSVHDVTGQRLLGTSRVSRIHGGCAVLEEWTAAAGTTGSSFNMFDERSGRWHQFWVDGTGTNWLSWDAEGNPATMRGGTAEGEMVMMAAEGTTPSARGRWKLLEDGRVRQIFESSSDGGESWQINFEGYYSRNASAAP